MKRGTIAAATAFFGAVLFSTALLSTQAMAKTGPVRSLNDQVRHELLMLPYVGVFDDLNYSIDPNGVVTLSGEVVRPISRSDAERAVKTVPGVARVDNHIEVLPLSPFDNRIRAATLRTLLRSGSLSKYFQGVHPDIRIIVKNGHVRLNGEVLNEGDREMAYIVANGVPGAFSVTNNLQIAVR